MTSLVERVSRFAVFLRNNDRQSRPIMDGLIQTLQSLPHLARRSITFDRGTEFTEWPYLQAGIGTQTWFCDPQSGPGHDGTARPCQRGPALGGEKGPHCHDNQRVRTDPAILVTPTVSSTRDSLFLPQSLETLWRKDMPTFAATGPSVLKRVDSLTGRLGLVASAILAAAACFTRRGVHMPRLAAFLSPYELFSPAAVAEHIRSSRHHFTRTRGD